MSAHTPGPLEVRTAPHPESGESAAEFMASLLRGGGSLFVVIASDPERPAPDFLVTAVTGDGPAARANAHLYAAAPDLLAACKRQLATLDGPLNILAMRDAHRALAAAAAKAEGRA